MSYRGHYNGKNFRSTIKYEPTKKAASFVDYIWMLGGHSPDGGMMISLELLMKDGSRVSFSTKNSLEELFAETDEWIEKNLPS